MPGTEVPADELSLVGAARPVKIRIERRIGEVPHGDAYHGTVSGMPVLVTYVDPPLAAQLDARAQLLRNVQRAAGIEHRSLLAQHGAVTWDQRLLLVQGNPGGQSARQLIVDRAAKGRTVDPETAQTIIGHVCNALTSLHTAMVHGYVNADAVWISTSGRVSLGDPGVGPLLARMPRFERMRAAGRLASVAPEQLLAPPRLETGTDVFGVATLLIELLTGRALREAGAPLEEVGIYGPPDLSLCLERATAPDVGARPPDVLTFKAELAEAMGPGARVDLRAPGSPLPAGMVMPSLAGGPPPPPPPRASAMPPPPPLPMQPAAMTPPHGMVAQPGIVAPPGMQAVLVPQGMVVPHGMVVLGVVPGNVPAAAPVPAAPPGRVAPQIAPDALRELELATRRIAEASAGASALDLTEDVAESSTRLAAEAELGSPSASASLRLDLPSADAAAERLATVDGEAAPIARNDHAAGSGSYFGSIGDSTVDSTIAGSQREQVPAGRRGTVAIDDDDVEHTSRSYRLVRDGQDFGELTLAELRQQIANGRVSANDTLVHPLTQRRLKVGDVPELRREITSTRPGAPVATPASPIAQRPMMLQTSSGVGGTLMWIVVAIAVFGGIGAWLWLRAQG